MRAAVLLFRKVVPPNFGSGSLWHMVMQFVFSRFPAPNLESYTPFRVEQSLVARRWPAGVFPGATGVAADNPAICHFGAHVGGSGRGHEPVPCPPGLAGPDRSGRQLTLAASADVARRGCFHGNDGRN